MRQFYLAPAAAPPVPGDLVTLDDEESHHLLKVLRARADRPVQLVDGEGRRLTARPAGRAGRRARLEVLEVIEDAEEGAPPRLRLACGVVKGRRWEWALEKSVECGAHVVAPLLAERGVVDPGAGRRERWLGVLRSALKQSGRCLLPALAEPVPLAAFLADDPGGPLAYAALPAERGGAAPGVLPGPEDGGPAPAWLTVAVGPEGGWTAAEQAALRAAGALPLDLGPHVLRTETAAVAALLAAQAVRRRWRSA